MKNNILILVAGKSHSGKGTFSEKLESILKNEFNTIRCSLSTYIRQITKNDFYWDGIDSSKSRKFMAEVYRLGSEIYPYHMARRIWERDITPNLIDKNTNIIIVESFRELNNYIYFQQLQKENLIDKIITINIIRPNYNDISEKLKKHISETNLDKFNFDYTILNDKDIEELSHKTKTFAYSLMNDIVIQQKNNYKKFEYGSYVKITNISNVDNLNYISQFINKKGYVINYDYNKDEYRVVFNPNTPNELMANFNEEELELIKE